MSSPPQAVGHKAEVEIPPHSEASFLLKMFETQGI